MTEHTLTITLTETYIPSGDAENYRAAIGRVLEEIAKYARYIVTRDLVNDVTVTVAVAHPTEDGDA